MAQQSEITQISAQDLDFVHNILAEASEPLRLGELTTKLAFEKTASELNQPIKKYDPSCRYEVGDLIYKEYNEPLMVSSKNTEMFTGAVVLRVVNKIPYESYNCEMLEVDYSGGGIFRKHIDYMKKTKTQVLLPSNLDGQNIEPEIVPHEQDPRLHEIPLTEKDLKKLERNLEKALHHDERFFSWEEWWALTEKQVTLPEEKIEATENYIREKQHSVATEEIIQNIFDIPPRAKEYALACMSFNALVHKKHRKKFVYTFPEGWGKWILKEILEEMSRDIPLMAPPITPPEEVTPQKSTLLHQVEYPLKIYLGWRDILSGGVRLPLALKKELSAALEYILEDPEEEKEYSVFYFAQLHAFLGLKDIYDRFHVPQGASLTLEKRTKTRFRFWLKTSKKKISFPQLTYDPATDTFQKTGEEFFSYALPNKIIHIDDESLERLLQLYDQREVADLRELLVLIYKEFSPEEERSLHYLKAYHLVDVLRRTTQEDVEATLQLAPEFEESEKRKGVYIYHEKVKTEEELAVAEQPPERPAAEGLSLSETLIAQILEEERAAREKKEEAPPEEVTPPPAAAEEAVEVGLEEQPAAAEQPPEAEAPVFRPAEPPKTKEKEKKPKKAPKKKKQKMRPEIEMVPRRRRGEKKFIEERIELEEFEHEALIATKAKEEVEEEIITREDKEKEKKKEAVKPFISQPTGFGGIFAEKLRSALEDKKKKPKEKK
ncbi:MAG: hypothetical protein DRJ11_03565 [Candidatus Aminicenantes bacterium]|nr:MAG: hypothetical protein DRJ11_03565 [Candidatus Aminicenantes bacterium]